MFVVLPASSVLLLIRCALFRSVNITVRLFQHSSLKETFFRVCPKEMNSNVHEMLVQKCIARLILKSQKHGEIVISQEIFIRKKKVVEENSFRRIQVEREPRE